MHVHVNGDPVPLRLSTLAIANGTYDASPTERPCNDYNQLILECDLTLNAATDVRIMLEAANPATGPNGATVAPAAGDWFPISAQDAASFSSSGAVISVSYRQLEIVLPATGKYSIPVPLCYRYVRVKAKASGGPGTTSLAIDGIFGRV